MLLRCERCGSGRGKSDPLVAAKRGVGKARDRPVADAGVVFLPVRKTPDAQSGRSFLVAIALASASALHFHT